MRTFDMTLGGHEFEKQNIVTIGKKRGYDVYKCKKCGITGKSYRLGMIDIKDADVKKMQKCNSLKKGKSLYKKVKIINCKAFGDQFKNIIPGSVHNIVPPPPGESSERGEWVMGVSEPVLLLAGEYMYIE